MYNQNIQSSRNPISFNQNQVNTNAQNSPIQQQSINTQPQYVPIPNPQQINNLYPFSKGQ